MGSQSPGDCDPTQSRRDWHAWHREYDDPQSSLARRLRVVRHEVGTALSSAASDGGSTRHLISMCAGDGRDVLPVLAANHADVSATLVEHDPDLADRARAEAARLALGRVDARTADAGTTDAYAGCPPANVLLACGVFGNVTDDDVAATIHGLPMLLAPHARVLWTRGRREHPDDPSRAGDEPAEQIRTLFRQAGFDEVAFHRPDDARYRVGVHRFSGTPWPRKTGLRMFSFVR